MKDSPGGRPGGAPAAEKEKRSRRGEKVTRNVSERKGEKPLRRSSRRGKGTQSTCAGRRIAGVRSRSTIFLRNNRKKGGGFIEKKGKREAREREKPSLLIDWRMGNPKKGDAF